MVDYRWQCLVCETGNEPKAKYCQECGCPVDADTGIAEGWIRSRSEPSRNPNNIGYQSRRGEFAYKFIRTAPCPYCGLHMYITDSQCPHCSYELTLSQRHQLIEWQAEEQTYGRKLGLKIFPISILIFGVIFYVGTNFNRDRELLK